VEDKSAAPQKKILHLAVMILYRLALMPSLPGSTEDVAWVHALERRHAKGGHALSSTWSALHHHYCSVCRFAASGLDIARPSHMWM
jgi:hypothetical protein